MKIGFLGSTYLDYGKNMTYLHCMPAMEETEKKGPERRQRNPRGEAAAGVQVREDLV